MFLFRPKKASGVRPDGLRPQMPLSPGARHVEGESDTRRRPCGRFRRGRPTLDTSAPGCINRPMPRLTPLTREDVPEEARTYFDLDVERYGIVLNNTGLYAHNVEVLRAIKDFVGAFGAAKAIPFDQKAMIRVRIAGINGCTFCADLHSALGKQHGLTDEKLAALTVHKTSPAFDPREHAALEYADAITYSDRDVSDELFARLRELYTDEEIVELTCTVAFENFLSKFHRALRVEPNGFCASVEAATAATSSARAS